MLNPPFVTRRALLNQLAMLVGGTLSAPVLTAFRGGVPGNVPENTRPLFTPQEQTYLAALAETILPATDTPGAKAAGVGAFIEYIIGHCTVPAQQQAFREGLASADRLSQTTFNQPIDKLTDSELIKLVKLLGTGEKVFFKMLRELTIVGYFTSEIGATQALAYVAVPGRFAGDIPLTPYQRTWAI